MKSYETIFLTKQNISPTQVEKITEYFIGFLVKNDAKTYRIKYCGLRPLCYPINKSNRAHYILMNFSCSIDTLNEMKRQMKLHEDIIRVLTLNCPSIDDGSCTLIKQSKLYKDDDHWGATLKATHPIKQVTEQGEDEKVEQDKA